MSTRDLLTEKNIESKEYDFHLMLLIQKLNPLCNRFEFQKIDLMV